MPTHHCLISFLKNRLSLCSTEAANYTLASFRVNSFFTFFFAASEAALPPRPPLKNPEQHSEIIHHSSQIVNDFNYLDNLFRPTSPSASHPVSAYPAEGDAHYIDLDFPVNSFFEIILKFSFQLYSQRNFGKYCSLRKLCNSNVVSICN